MTTDQKTAIEDAINDAIVLALATQVLLNDPDTPRADLTRNLEGIVHLLKFTETRIRSSE